MVGYLGTAAGSCIAGGLALAGVLLATMPTRANPSDGGGARSITARSVGIVLDAKTASGIGTTSGSRAISGSPLTTADTGKVIIIPGAGSGGVPLITTISDPAHLATAADVTTSPSTYYAPPGFNCPVATAQRGDGDYAPGDEITLNDGGSIHSVCTVQYTQAVSATLLSRGTGCTGRGVFYLGIPGDTPLQSARIGVRIDNGSVTAITGIAWGGRYSKRNPGTPSGEALVGRNCRGVTAAVHFGVAIARVTTPGQLKAMPGDPVAQLSTSGGGSGATFNMRSLPNSNGTVQPVWTTAGSALYGTDNTAAFARLAANGNSQTVQFPAGTALLNCGSYDMASSTSLRGAGRDVTKLKLFPYCRQSGDLFVWRGHAGVTVRDLTFDANFAYAARPLPPAATSPFVNQGGDNFLVENVSISNLSNLWIGLRAVSTPSHGIDRIAIRGSSIAVPHPDATPTYGMAIIDGGNTGIRHMLVDRVSVIGAGSAFCADGTVENTETKGWAYGGGLYTPARPPNCKSTRFVNNTAHDSLMAIDTNHTAPVGMELHGSGFFVSGFRAWNNAGGGIRCESTNSDFRDARLWDNGRISPLSWPGFGGFGGFETAAGPNEPNGCGGSYLNDINSFDGGAKTQSYGYREINNGLSPPPPRFGERNHFSGAIAAKNTQSGAH